MGIMDLLRSPLGSIGVIQYGLLDVPQLQLALIQAEETEQKELHEVNTKYNTQIQEIMDELTWRCETEITKVEIEYIKKKDELLKEIKRREIERPLL